MCLIPDSNKASFTFEPIECYKVVDLGPLSVNPRHQTFRSIFQDFPYRIGKRYRCRDFSKFSYYVYEGYHSYSSLYTAGLYSSPDNIILRCKIPAFSWYYKNSRNKELCSNRIKVTGWKKSSEIDSYRNYEDIEWHTKRG